LIGGEVPFERPIRRSGLTAPPRPPTAPHTPSTAPMPCGRAASMARARLRARWTMRCV